MLVFISIRGGVWIHTVNMRVDMANGMGSVSDLTALFLTQEVCLLSVSLGGIKSTQAHLFFYYINSQPHNTV